MAAIIKQLETKPQKLKKAQYEDLRQALLPFEEVAPDLINSLIYQIGKQTQTSNRWTFVMISPEQNEAVVDWLSENSTQAQKAVILWLKLFKYLHIDTGEVMVTRAEIANQMKMLPRHVSTVMSELVKCGAITRKKEGRGVRYFMNPNIATHTTGTIRDEQQRQTSNVIPLR